MISIQNLDKAVRDFLTYSNLADNLREDPTGTAIWLSNYVRDEYNFGLKFTLKLDMKEFLNGEPSKAIMDSIDTALHNKLLGSELFKYHVDEYTSKIKELEEVNLKLKEEVERLIPYKNYVDVQKEINIK